MVPPMNEKELIGKVHSPVYHQCQRRGYAAPVDVLMDIGVLPKQKYEDWRFGKVDCQLGQYPMHPIPQSILPPGYILQVGVVNAPGFMHAAGQLV